MNEDIWIERIIQRMTTPSLGELQFNRCPITTPCLRESLVTTCPIPQRHRVICYNWWIGWIGLLMH